MICTGAEKVILSVLVFPRRVEEWEEMGWMPTQETYNKKYYFLKNNKEYQIIDPKYWAVYLDQMGYFHQYIITPHPELQQKMIQKYTEFWNENVLKEIPPEPQDYADIKALCPIASGTLVANENIERLASEYKNITEEIGNSGELAKRKNQLKIEILNYMIKQDDRVEKIIDDDSVDKFILRDRQGKKLFQYNGKVFR